MPFLPPFLLEIRPSFLLEIPPSFLDVLPSLIPFLPLSRYLAKFFNNGVKKRWGSVFNNLSRDPFIVCGDSLVCACLERALFGGDHYDGAALSAGKVAGFQTLSLVYQVEWFLKELSDRGAEFRILFCQDSKKLWLGAGRLARDLVEAHIMKNTSAACDVVGNYTELPALIKKNRPGFFMCKVGWKVDGEHVASDELAYPLSSVTGYGLHSPLLALYVRSMTMQIISDVNVGVVVDLQLTSKNNSLVFVDESDFTGFSLYTPSFYDTFAPVRTLELVAAEADATKSVSSAGAVAPAEVPCPRLQLALESLTSMFEDTDALSASTPETVVFLAKVFLLHTCLCSVLPLNFRSQNVGQFVSDTVQETDVRSFVDAIAVHLAASICKTADDVVEDNEGEQKGKVLVMCDTLDARVMQVILLFVDVCATENGGACELNLAKLCGDNNAPLKVPTPFLSFFLSFPSFLSVVSSIRLIPPPPPPPPPPTPTPHTLP
jgi:hypothetical protein